MKGGLICTLIFSGIGAILAAVSLAIDYWYRSIVLVLGRSIELKFGLWKGCVSGVRCFSWNDIPELKVDWLHACQGMMVLCTSLAIFGIVIILLHILVLKHTKQLTKLASIMFIVAGIFGCLTVFVFSAKYKDYRGAELLAQFADGDLYVGFALAVVSAIMMLIAGVLAFCTKPSPYESY